MPLYDVGYRRWVGPEHGTLSRSLAIARKGLEIVYRSNWVRRMLFFAWLPAVWFGAMFFMFEQQLQTEQNSFGSSLMAEVLEASDIGGLDGLENIPRTGELERRIKNELSSRLKKAVDDGEIGLAEAEQISRNRRYNRTALSGFVEFIGFGGSGHVVNAILDRDGEGRRDIVWSWLILQFFRLPQGLALLILIGWVAPALISRDIRTKALLLYFSRPLSKLSYIFGKFMIVAGVSVFITTVPALLLYALAIGLSPSFEMVLETWDLPIRIVLASLVYIVPASLMALAFSSLTSESRYAMFAWYAVWGLGGAAWLVIYLASLEINNMQPDQFSANLPFFEGGVFQFLSLFSTIGSAQSLVMQGANANGMPFASLVFLVVLSIVSFLVIGRRIGKAVLQ